MAARLLPLLVVWALTAAPVSAEPPTSPKSPQEPASQAEQKPEHPILREAFQSQLSKEQLAQFKGQPSIEKLIGAMTPDQKAGARVRLGEAEAEAATPEALKEIAKGYLMLDEKSPNPGEGAVRVAARLRKMEPENSEGFTLAASGYHQMGDYPAAAQWARDALKRDPKDETAKTVFMLSVGRSRRGGPDMDGATTTAVPDAGFAVGEWHIPERGVSPQALTLMQQAVVARRAGDMRGTMALTQAAMNADPTSANVQKFYQIVEADQRKHADTTEFLRLSKEAMAAGRGTDAVAWAQKAAERSKDPTVFKILELMIQKNEKQSEASVKEDLASKETPTNSGFPLWPLGAGAGLMAIGYGVARSRGTWAEQDAETPSDEGPNSGRIQNNRHRLKVAAASVAVSVAIVYGGGWLIRVGGPALLTMFKSGNASLQRTLTSEAGAVFPEEQIAAQRAAAGARTLSTANPPTASRFFEGAKYSERVLTQMEGTDYHAFPEIVKNYANAGQVRAIRGGDGITRWMLRVPGSYHGQQGVFEFIKEPDGVITHRLFNPNP